MTLCTTCTSIDILDIPKLPASCNGYSASNKSPFLIPIFKRSRLSQTPTSQNSDEPLGIPFHESLDELDTAAEHCAICKVIQQDVIAFQAAYAEDRDEQRSSKGSTWKMWLAKGVNDINGFMVVSADAEKTYLVWVLSAVGLCVEGKESCLVLDIKLRADGFR
jgi:hypothetical protein